MKKVALPDKLDLENILPISLEVDEEPMEPSDALEYVADLVGNNSYTILPTEEEDKMEPEEIIFKLDLIPGVQEDEFVEEEEPEEEVEEVEPEDVDLWDWNKQGGMPKFLEWVQKMFDNIPKHSGKDTTGIERALAYFERLNKEISMAMRKDYKREIDSAKAEQAREEIEKGMERLVERLDKLRSKKLKKGKKKAFYDAGIIKEAETSTTGRTYVSVPYFISNVARTCIEATIQAGKDIEDCFNKMADNYKLDNREKFQIAQLIKDMGYPILMDRLNFDKDIEPTKLDTSEFIRQYYG